MQMIDSSKKLEQTKTEVSRFVVGQQHLIDRLLLAMLCNGHVLLEGVPGIAKTLTDLQGSSTWFEYGFVSYGNNAKMSMLGVAPDLLDQHGAVSHQVVEAMASGAVSASGYDYAIAVTGIAGPDGD